MQKRDNHEKFWLGFSAGTMLGLVGLLVVGTKKGRVVAKQTLDLFEEASNSEEGFKKIAKIILSKDSDDDYIEKKESTNIKKRKIK